MVERVQHLVSVSGLYLGMMLMELYLIGKDQEDNNGDHGIDDDEDR